MKIQVRYPLLAALICFAWPLSAWAIGSPSTNFFIKGLYHPMMVPAHLIALFALGLLIGQQGWASLCTAFPVFFVTLTAALLMTRYQSAAWNAELVLLPLAALTGVLVVLRLNLPKAIPLIIAIIAAIVIGMDSSVPRIPGLQATKIYAHLSGSGVFASLLLLMTSLLALALHKLLAGIVLRVLGAWSTAGAVLVVTLLLVTDATP